MAIKGKISTGASNYSKKIGVSEFKIVAINPTHEQMKELLKFDGINAPKYSKEDEDGNKQIVLSFYMQDVNDPDAPSIPYNITITKKDNFSEGTMKYQYINSIGNTSWAKDDADLKYLASNLNSNEGYRTAMQSFLKRSYRVAKPGEEQLYSFLLKYTNLDIRDVEAELSYDLKKFFNENFKELENDLKSYKENTITLVYTINTKKTAEVVNEETGEVTPASLKEFQGLYSKALPSGWSVYFSKNPGKKSTWVDTQLEKFGNEIRGKYGCKGFFSLESPARAYDPKENPMNDGSSIHQSEEVGAENTFGASGNIGIDDLPF